ncbi:hypothetical protein [Marinobacter santoriniensis]|nr:hypothetical protein [Marinobacter santoriniensis]
MKFLELIDHKTGENWVTGFIGNQGALIDGQFSERDGYGYYVADAETFEWWDNVVSDFQSLDDYIDDLKIEHGSNAVSDAINAFDCCDIEDMPRGLRKHLDDWF